LIPPSFGRQARPAIVGVLLVDAALAKSDFFLAMNQKYRALPKGNPGFWLAEFEAILPEFDKQGLIRFILFILSKI
jgi:hypothetical protein